ncbi:hypothetical protein E2C01_069236 [Portunus trituberculatus]|uniref:Uncharacterized protein n=1 Tax=Portunus trituberculatus TaxID=210409 RepID=A0A5B7I1M6_PORTR|nr:hypothetical protein [Portunus trituberculatus]
MARRHWSTCWTFQVSSYFGDDGLKLKEPVDKRMVSRSAAIHNNTQ